MSFPMSINSVRKPVSALSSFTVTATSFLSSICDRSNSLARALLWLETSESALLSFLI